MAAADEQEADLLLAVGGETSVFQISGQSKELLAQGELKVRSVYTCVYVCVCIRVCMCVYVWGRRRCGMFSLRSLD